MKTEAQQKAKRKYLAKGNRITIDFYPTEADLIEHIEKQPNKQGYIKDLIRQDMKKREVVYGLDGTVYVQDEDKQGFTGITK